MSPSSIMMVYMGWRFGFCLDMKFKAHSNFLTVCPYKNGHDSHYLVFFGCIDVGDSLKKLYDVHTYWNSGIKTKDGSLCPGLCTVESFLDTRLLLIWIYQQATHIMIHYLIYMFSNIHECLTSRILKAMFCPFNTDDSLMFCVNFWTYLLFYVKSGKVMLCNWLFLWGKILVIWIIMIWSYI